MFGLFRKNRNPSIDMDEIDDLIKGCERANQKRLEKRQDEVIDKKIKDALGRKLK